MYFAIDTKTQSVIGYKTLGEAARGAIKGLGEKFEGDDPVALFHKVNLDSRYVLLNLSGAFEAISESDDLAAQELAVSFKLAVDNYYVKR